MMTSFAEPMQTVSSNGQKRKSSSETPMPLQTTTPNTSIRADIETPTTIVEEPHNIGPNSDEP